MHKSLLFIAGIVIFISFKAHSSDYNSDSCYQFKMEQSAAMSSMPVLSSETWCYRKLSSPRGATFIYNVDSGVKPELSAIVEADGVVTHGSLVKGKVTTHRVHASDLNPLPVPLSEPQNMTPVFSQALEFDNAQVENVIHSFQSSHSDLPDMSISEGVFEGWVSQENLPWRGFWWSYKSAALAGTTNSPLAKYDRYVNARTGIMPRVASWERTYHKYRGISWEGHCNGWAASAVLRAEPNVSRIFPQTSLVFSVSDQKGILAEEDYCANVAFYGRRNNGKAIDDPKDIYPQDFHLVISYYVGQLRKVVAMDYMASRSVDNHLVSGYTFNIKQKDANTFTVDANLTVHRYDGTYQIDPGVAPSYVRNYKYDLTVDAFGNITGGKWLSENPDFLWVPLSPTDCLANNPRMKAQFVNEIISLPPISQISE